MRTKRASFGVVAAVLGLVVSMVSMSTGLAAVNSNVARRFTVAAVLVGSPAAGGGIFTIKGKVTPAAPGAAIIIQRRTRGAWKVVERQRLSRSSTFRVDQSQTVSGHYAYRVVKPAGRGLASGHSRQLHGVVTALAPLVAAMPSGPLDRYTSVLSPSTCPSAPAGYRSVPLIYLNATNWAVGSRAPGRSGTFASVIIQGEPLGSYSYSATCRAVPKGQADSVAAYRSDRILASFPPLMLTADQEPYVGSALPDTVAPGGQVTFTATVPVEDGSGVVDVDLAGPVPSDAEIGPATMPLPANGQVDESFTIPPDQAAGAYGAIVFVSYGGPFGSFMANSWTLAVPSGSVQVS